MVEHVYYILTGRKVLLPPKDLDDPLYAAKRRAYQEQRRQIEAIAARFAQVRLQPQERLQGLDRLRLLPRRRPGHRGRRIPQRRAELDDVGLVRMLAPEQVERKVAAVFGEPWGKLNDQLAMLYGGIDSKEVTERAADPSGAMGAIQRILANDVACKHVAARLRPPAGRAAAVSRHRAGRRCPAPRPRPTRRSARRSSTCTSTILGRYDAADSAEVERTFELFAGIVARRQASRRGSRSARAITAGANVPRTLPADPHYTIRAWRGVVTYLLRRPEFLYE